MAGLYWEHWGHWVSLSALGSWHWTGWGSWEVAVLGDTVWVLEVRWEGGYTGLG